MSAHQRQPGYQLEYACVYCGKVVAHARLQPTRDDVQRIKQSAMSHYLESRHTITRPRRVPRRPRGTPRPQVASRECEVQ